MSNQPTTKTPTPINSSFLPKAVQLASEFNASASCTWLTDYRNSQRELLQSCEFPHSRIEHFKYNRLHAFDNQDFAQILDDNSGNQRIDISTITTGNVAHIVFIDGQLSLELSDFTQHQITPFDQTDDKQQAIIIASLQSQNIAHNPFILANASLTNHGVFINIDNTSPADTIEISSIITDNASDSTLANQVVIDVAENCTAKVISRTISQTTDKPTALSTTRMVSNIADNSQLTHYHLSFESSDSLHFAHIGYNLHTNSQLDTFHAMTGSKLKKIDIEVNQLGQHALANVNGLYVANNYEQVDCHTMVNHPFANGKTDENFRGLVNGHGEAVFNGRIYIYPDAQKTLAEMSNKNLVLSDNAIIHAKPELEIYADDVICAHGATVSRLQNEALNYLRARGISKKEAELMLSYAFFDELLGEVEEQAVIDYIRPVLFKCFEG